MQKFHTMVRCLAILLLPTLSAAQGAPTYTVSTVYEAPEGSLLEQLVVDKDGNIYVVDRKTSTVIKIAPDGTGSTFAGGGTANNLLVPFILPDTPLTATDVNMGVLPNIEIDGDGNLYVQIGKNVWRISPEGQLTRFAGAKAFSSPVAPLSGLDGPALDANIPQPGGSGGVAIDGNGFVYLRTSTAKPQVLKIDKGGVLTLYAGNEERGNAGDGGPALSAQLYGLGEIEADAAGNLYLAEAREGIRKVSTDGTITTILSNPDASTVLNKNDVLDGIGALEAKFEDVLILTVGPDGSVFFTMVASNTVHQLTPDGKVTTIAGTGEGGFSGDGGPARDATFITVFGLAVDASGNVFVADRGNLRIRKLTPSAAPDPGGGDTGGGQTGGGDTGGGDTGTGDTTTPTVELPTGTRGPIALDLDTTAGDQGKVQTDANPKAGDQVVIDIVAVSGAQGNGGFQVKLQYDPAQLEYTGFQSQGVFAGAVVIPPAPAGGVVEINAAILGGSASGDAGSMGQATFRVLDGFVEQTRVDLSSASFNTSVEVGPGGAFVVIGGVAGSGGVIPEDPVEASDFSGDGTVDFNDFLTFAQNFGKRTGDADYNARIDLDQDGTVGFSDFLKFVQNFGQSVGG